jgi:hypothetical protein
MRRLRVVLAGALLVSAAAALPAGGEPLPGYAVSSDGASITVPVDGGGQVTLPVPPGTDLTGLRVTARHATKAEERRAARKKATRSGEARPGRPGGAAGPAGPVAAAGPGGGSTDEAASYPADPPKDPGTATTAAGGNCDGYRATEATISALRVAVDRSGRVFWVDRDVTVARHGSALIRTIGRDGRVRTLGSVVPPDTGRFDKVNGYWEFSVHVVPDDAGGVFVNSGWYRNDPYYADEQHSGLVVHLDAAGRRTVVAGGGERIGVDQSGTLAAAYRDGRLAVQAWLGDVHALTRDERGLYLSEDPGPGLRNLVRFVNTSGAAVTFYPGTPQAVVVQPGYIGTIAAQDVEGGALEAGGEAADGTKDASRYSYFKVAALAVRDQVLYTWDLSFNGIDSGPAHPAVTEHDKVEALNLGFDGRPRTVNGVLVPSGQVGVVAGSGSRPAGYAGDGGPARAAAFNVYWSSYSGGIAVAKDGTVYVADTRNQRVRAIDPAGIIRTVAGNGSPGYDGEGAAATTRVWNPIGISVDPSGAPVFAELENARIRRLADGRLTTVVGRGPTPCGAGRLATGRTAYGGAYFGRVPDVATDSKGNAYVADISYNVIQRVDAKGVVDLTIGRPTPCAAGRWGEFDPGACTETGPQDGDGGPLATAGLGDPRHLLVDAYDNLYVSDVDRVRYVNLSGRAVSVLGKWVAPRSIETVASFPRRLVVVKGVPFSDAVAWTTGQLGDLALDRRGALYVADPAYGVIHRLGPCAENGVIAGVPGPVESEGQGDGGPAKAAAVSPTGGMTYDRDRDVLLFVDHPVNGSARIRAINLSERSLLVVGRRIAAKAIDSVIGVGKCSSDFTGCSYGNGGQAYQAGISATGLELDPATRRLYLTEASNAVRVVLPDGRIAGLAGPVPEASAPPKRVYFGVRPVPVGGYAGDGGPAAQAWLRLGTVETGGHSGLAVTSRGDLLVADAGRVRRVSDVDNAPLRLDPSVQAAVPGAGDAFTPPVLLRDGLTDPDGAYAPQLRHVRSIGWVVAAARGRGRGCTAWNVLDDGNGTDAVWSSAGTMPGAAGRAASGQLCALGSDAGGVAVASVSRVAGGSRTPAADAGIDVAASADGAAWTARAAATGTERIGSTEGLGEVAAGTGGAGIDLAYRVTRDRFVVVRRADDGTMTPVGEVAAAVTAFGSVRRLADGRTLVAFVESGPPAPLGQHESWVSVAEVGNGASRVVRVAAVREDAHSAPVATPPSLDLAADGTAVLAFSDDRRIVVARGTRDGRWPVVATGSVAGAAVLPSVVAGRNGQVALAYYLNPRIGSTALDARSADGWYAAVSLLGGGARGAVALTPLVASPRPVELGPLCLAACIRTSAPGDAQLDTWTSVPPAPRVLGPVAAGVDEHGVLRLAYTVGPRMSGAGEASVLATQRLCLRTHTSAGGRCESSFGDPVDEHPAAPPAVEPPPLPEPPPVGIGCSPLPPAFHRRPVNPPPSAPAPDPVPPPRRPGIPRTVAGAALAPVLPPPPAPPAPIVQPAPQVEGASATQPQPVPQSQPGVQAGLAAEDEQQAEVVEEYAFSARRDGEAATYALWLVGATAICAAAGVARRRRTSVVRVRF